MTVDRAPDVLVVGAGTMGAWTAIRCVREGLRTTLLDAWGAGHPRATSGDENRIIRSSHGPDAFYARWSRRS
ncbi:MAG TPA: FAD-dependent oxidoreductase, partial [Candidatus Limnocylindrales bacterium]